jgi:hypothetical protein
MGVGKILAIGVIGIFVIGIIAVIIGVLALGYLGFIPGLSDIMGTNKPRDLGVTYSEANYASGIAKVPGAVVINPEYLCVGCSYKSSGSVTIDTSFTEEEFTAMFNKRNETKGPIQDAQFKFNADGSMEASAMIDHPQIKGPIYIKGEITGYTSRGLEFDLEEVEFGRAQIPQDQIPEAEKIVEDAIDQTFANNPGLSITKIAIEDGEIVFDGTLPKEVTGDPNTVIAGLN